VTFAGVVLAAGAGTRLRPLTDLLPKALCPVDNVSLLDGALDRLADAGVGSGSLAVNIHSHAPRMLDHLADRPDVHLSLEEPVALGTAGALGNLRGWIDGRDVVVHNADAWHRADIGALLVDGWDRECIRLLVVDAGEPADFGSLRYAGVAAMPWRNIADLEAEPSGLYEVSWRAAHAGGRIELVRYEGDWFDTGTPATYLAANMAASGGQSVIAPDAHVDPSAIVERSVVWPGARVDAAEHLVDSIRAWDAVTVHVPRTAVSTKSAGR